MQNRLMLFMVICMSMMLTSCRHENEEKKLKSYINTVKARRSSQIEPIPEVQKTEKYTYPNVKRRNPFKVVVKHNVTGAGAPDQSRIKQALEQFTLDSLKMVGTLSREGEVSAIISAPDGIFYRVSVGKYIGQHYGKVTEISDKKVFIDELVNAKGGWQRRPTKLDLVEGS